MYSTIELDLLCMIVRAVLEVKFTARFEINLVDLLPEMPKCVSHQQTLKQASPCSTNS